MARISKTLVFGPTHKRRTIMYPALQSLTITLNFALPVLPKIPALKSMKSLSLLAIFLLCISMTARADTTPFSTNIDTM